MSQSLLVLYSTFGSFHSLVLKSQQKLHRISCCKFLACTVVIMVFFYDYFMHILLRVYDIREIYTGS